MTEEEIRQIDDATLSAISFGLETSMVHYGVFAFFFLFNIVAYMVANLSFILQVPPIHGGQSAGDEVGPIKKGKIIRCFLLDEISMHSCKMFVVMKFNYILYYIWHGY